MATGPDPIEQLILDCAQHGKLVDLLPGTATGKELGRDVDALMLARLLVDREGKGPFKRLILRGASIRGLLDLEGLDLGCPLYFLDCRFEEPLVARYSRLGALSLHGSTLDNGLEARGITVRGDLSISRVSAAAAIDLKGARIGGALQAAGATLRTRDGSVLALDGAEIGGDLFLREGFEAEGEVRAAGAHVSGQISLSGATIRNPGDYALTLDSCTVGEDVFAHGLEAVGSVHFLSARIQGSFLAERATFTNPGGVAIGGDRAELTNFALRHCKVVGMARFAAMRARGQMVCKGTSIAEPKGLALVCDASSFGSEVFLSEGFEAEGEVRFLNARVTSTFDCSNGAFVNPGGEALRLEGVKIGAELLCRRKFRAVGEVGLAGAAIELGWDCRGGRFANASGVAIDADGCTVQGDVAFSHGFEVDGEVRMRNARVHGDLDCRGARLHGSRDAFNLRSITVERSVRLSDGFVAEGLVRLSSGQIGGLLICDRGKFRSREGRAIAADRLAVDGNLTMRGALVEGEARFVGARVKNQLNTKGAIFVNPGGTSLNLAGASAQDTFLRPREATRGMVNLRHAQFARLYDNELAWRGGYDLEGCHYDIVGSPPFTRAGAATRLEWLAGNRHGYRPQIYDTLAQAYGRIGHQELQRMVLVAKQRRLRVNQGRAARLWSYMQDGLFGFGYRAWQVLVLLAALVAFGTIYFSAHESDIPARIQDHTNAHFNSFVYSLDLLLPVIDLGQRDNFVALHGALVVSTALIAIGWIITTALVAALAGLITRPTD